MGNSKKFLSLGLSALSILPMGALLSSNINAGAGKEEQQRQYYTATFDFNGGTYEGKTNATVYFDKYLVLLPAGGREGYKFIGWEESELPGQIFTNKDFKDWNSDIHFKAVWKPIDVKLQPIDSALDGFHYTVSAVDQILSGVEKRILKVEKIYNCNMINYINMMNIIKNNKKIAEVKEELLELNAKQEECKEQVELLKFELDRFQRRAALFENQVAEATEIVDSVIDQEQVSMDIINSLQIPMLSLELDVQGIGNVLGIRCHLFNLESVTRNVDGNVDDFKIMLENFYRSNKELFNEELSFVNVEE